MVMGRTHKDHGWNNLAVYLTALTNQPYPTLRIHGSNEVIGPFIHSASVEVTV